MRSHAHRAVLWITSRLTSCKVWYAFMHMKEKLYYIVGVSLLVLLVLIVYVGSRVQNVELGLATIDARLGAIESQFGLDGAMGYYEPAADQYGASAYDALTGDGSGAYYVPYDEYGMYDPYAYDYVTE